ncbi:hypothetical protein, partial [Neisseria musculi]|uniref:hypothetical protein n=1 Tax=Neisseria musculi TaxID=1815583 RepID=UPI00360FEFBF
GVTAAESALAYGMPTAAVQNIINRLNEPAIPKSNLPGVSAANAVRRIFWNGCCTVSGRLKRVMSLSDLKTAADTGLKVVYF